MQTAWTPLANGLLPDLDLSPVSDDSWTGGPPSASASPAPSATQSDGVGSPWYANPSTAASSAASSLTGLANAGPFGGLVQNVMNSLSGLVSSFFGGTTPLGTAGTTGGYAPPPTVTAGNLTLSSTGDPHLAETGTVVSNGTTQNVNTHVDSMTAHPDLVDTKDVPGGYRVSTTVTAPSANGVTYNQSATVTTGWGRDQVTMNANGAVSVTCSGNSVPLTAGQTLALGPGSSVTMNGNGSVVVNASNGAGGSISTTMQSNGNGVDVTTNAQNLTVGGAIVNDGADPGTGGYRPRMHTM